MTMPPSALSPATIASRRHLARIALRTSVLLIVLYALRIVIGSMNGWIVTSALGWFSTFIETSLPVIAWLLVAGILLFAEKWLVLWLVPQPRPGCPNCGYDTRTLRSPICPECGENLRPPAATPRRP